LTKYGVTACIEPGDIFKSAIAES